MFIRITVSAAMFFLFSCKESKDTSKAGAKEIDTALTIHQAASLGQTKAIQRFLDNGAKIDATDSRGLQPIHMAAESNQAEAVKFILAHGGVVTPTRSPISPFFLAVSKGHIETANLLLQAGADIESVSHGYTAVHIAAEAGQLEMLKFLAKKGADLKVSVPGEQSFMARQCIHLAAGAGRVEVLKWLIENGASVNTPPRVSGPYSQTQLTPLHCAAEKGRLECVNLLLEHGADVNATIRRDDSPLVLAAWGKYYDVMHVLMAKGARTDDENGIIKGALLKETQDAPRK